MFQVGIVGRICGVDLLMAEALLKNGLSCVIFRPSDEKKTLEGENIVEKGPFTDCISDENVYRFKSPFDFYRNARKCKLILDINLGLFSGLRCHSYLRFLPFFPPVINLTTGSDIAELIDKKSLLSPKRDGHP